MRFPSTWGHNFLIYSLILEGNNIQLNTRKILIYEKEGYDLQWRGKMKKKGGQTDVSCEGRHHLERQMRVAIWSFQRAGVM